MARVVIIGGGFGGLIAAEKLALALGDEHEITLVSESDQFVFYPALVQLAFERCEPKDISFDLRPRLATFKVRHIKAEVIDLDTGRKRLRLIGNDFNGDLSYDYLLIATGRRLATEKAPGFFEYAHHILDVPGAIRFGNAIKGFHEGAAVIGLCPHGDLPVPVCETAFALVDHLKKEGFELTTNVTVLFPESIESAFGGAHIGAQLKQTLERHNINVVTDFPIGRVEDGFIEGKEGQRINYELLMLIPPFKGQALVTDAGITDVNGFIKVNGKMQVAGLEGVYAAGDAVAFSGPKIGHMAVRQAHVAAENIVLEIKGEDPIREYYHEIATVIDAGGSDSMYLHYGIWDDEQFSSQQGYFWGWAKKVHDKIWQAIHS
jgi:sulfide:quinone oxidoreductase